MGKTNGIVDELKVLLGEPAVFINWPRGVKGSTRKWKHLRPANMTPAYLSKLPRGNIGVALGEVSGGLCAIDLDNDAPVQPFLSANSEPFFITLRACAELLEIKSHRTIETMLGALRKLRYIKVVEPGNAHRATRYNYIWSSQG